MTSSEHETEVDGLHYRVSIDWKLLGGRQEPVAVTIESVGREHPVVADLIRRLPLGSIQRAHRQFWAVDKGSMAVGVGPHRGSPLTPTDLEAVAGIYEEAWQVGGVTKAVAEAFGISSSAASKRIIKARDAGLLDGIGRPTKTRMNERRAS